MDKPLSVVVALGGNALGDTPEDQLSAVAGAADAVAGIAALGHRVAVGHGNGPQVGMINLAMDYAASGGAGTPAMPFPECGAMSQGYIGYHLQQSIARALTLRGLPGGAVSLVTQVVVDENDPAFQHPSKPIGSFLTKEEADARAARNGFTYAEDAGRGYRRVVPSPLPLEIVELDAVRTLSAAGNVVVTVGGGGVPVVRRGGALHGVAAVIDKDRSCARLAQDLNSDVLLILTAVDRVCIRFGKPDERALDSLTAAEAKNYIAEGHFARGSMLPKVEACLDFVAGAPGRRAVITSLANAARALSGVGGTVITA